MSEFHVVTSCSYAGWEKYGRRFVETFKQFWPASVQLHVVSEDALPGLDGDSKFWRLDQSEAWTKFQHDNIMELWVRGDGAAKRPSGIAPRWLATSGLNFRFDAWKFSKKVFAIELVADSIKCGRLCWIDADVLTFAPVPEDLPQRMLPIGKAISCLSRRGYHSECGFVGYNLHHSATMNFIRAFSNLYTSAEVFKLAEWHDSWVFDWLRNKMLIDTYAIPHKSHGHPFINSELGLYMDHLKGKRKDTGRSQGQEQIVHGKLPYWQGGHRRV